MKHSQKALCGYGVSGSTKFMYPSFYYVMELIEVSVPFLNTTLIVRRSVDYIEQCCGCKEALMI